MKKKLLSLVLAGAMVASTSVSAFADTDRTTLTVENGTVEHQVTVRGDVQNTSGDILPSTISVTVPTAVSFTIDKKGNIDSANINITSNSDEKVDVIAYKFVDPSTNSKITVVSPGELSSQHDDQSSTNRRVSLSITGGTKEVDLKSANGSTSGILKDDGSSEYELTDAPVIGTVTKGNELNLKIGGNAAVNDAGEYKAPTEPIKDEFKLTLKIKKQDKQSR